MALVLACYRYVPASLDVVPSGSAVRATLSTESQLALRDSLGLRRQTVQGTLVERDGDRLLHVLLPQAHRDLVHGARLVGVEVEGLAEAVLGLGGAGG